jgi:hypothetical protein
MVWPDRAQPVEDFYNGTGCQYCLGQGHAFGGHPFSREGYLGNETCPVCRGRPMPAAAAPENNAPGGMQYGAPGQGGGGVPSAMLDGREGLEFRRERNPNKALGVGNAT